MPAVAFQAIAHSRNRYDRFGHLNCGCLHLELLPGQVAEVTLARECCAGKIRSMGYVIEEWVGDHSPYRTYPVVRGGPFATRPEAKEEAKKHEPQHGGFITVVPEPGQETPKPKRKGRKKPRLRENRRPSSRR